MENAPDICESQAVPFTMKHNQQLKGECKRYKHPFPWNLMNEESRCLHAQLQAGALPPTGVVTTQTLRMMVGRHHIQRLRSRGGVLVCRW